MKLYTIDCPACRVLEKKLDQKGIEYEKVTDEQVFNELEINVFPVLEVEGTLYTFAEAVSMLNSL